jgi:hypothetical protein
MNNLKISIGINSYKPFSSFNEREKMCYESLIRIKEKTPKNVSLYNVLFKDENFVLKNFETVCGLNNYFISEGKKLPYVNDIFDILATTDCDYFIFINNDVAVSNRFVKTILQENDKDCFPATKLHFTKLDSIDDPSPIPQSVSVHGFEGFGIKKDWWIKNKIHFKQMVLGCAYWDTYFFTKCMLYGNCKVLNKPPLPVFHLDHKSNSMQQSQGNQYNENNFATDKDMLGPKWFGYVQNVLLKRPTYNNILWYTPFSNEEELEKIYFKL